jgi:hypothetical protein
MAEVFEVLAKDHAEVKQMLAELETGPTAASGTTGNDPVRAQEDGGPTRHRGV